MTRTQENGFQGTQVVDEPSDRIASGRPPSANGNEPYVPQKDKAKPSLKDNTGLLVIGAGIVLVLLLFAFNGISRRSSPSTKSTANGKQQQPQSLLSAREPASITPILDTGRSPAQDTDSGVVNPDQIGRTATKQPKPSPGANLASVPPFDNAPQWQPAAFQPGVQPADTAGTTETKSEHDAMDKTSLVFVRNSQSSPAGAKPQDTQPAID